MPRKVVSTVAFGADEYLICAELMFKSLRRVGWSHECICFTDRSWDFPPDLNIQVINLPKTPSMKCSAFLNLGLSDGDSFIMVDTDVLFVRNPDELVELNDDSVWCCQTGYPLKIFEFNQVYMTEHEIKNIPPDMGCLNTGFIYIPGGEIGTTFSEKWANFHSKNRGDFEYEKINIVQDQPALETLLIRDEVELKKFPVDYMFFPSLVRNKEPKKECVVLHFTGYPYDKSGKIRLIEAMKRAIVEI